MSTIKFWNGTSWELAIVGKQGPQGLQGVTGDDGFIAQATPPANTSLLWLDTDEPATVSGVNQIVAGTNVTLSPAGGTGVVTVNSGIPTGGTLNQAIISCLFSTINENGIQRKKLLKTLHLDWLSLLATCRTYKLLYIPLF